MQTPAATCLRIIPQTVPKNLREQDSCVHKPESPYKIIFINYYIIGAKNID